MDRPTRAALVLLTRTAPFLILGAPLTAEVDERCPGTALESGPSLIGGLNQIKQLIRQERNSGRFAFRLTITDTGTVRDVQIIAPESLKESQKLRSSIAALKFCPAVRFNRYVSVTVNFEIQVE